MTPTITTRPDQVPAPLAKVRDWWWRRRGYRVATFEAIVTRANGTVEIHRQVTKLPKVKASG